MAARRRGDATRSRLRPVARADAFIDVISVAGRISDLPPERQRWFTQIDRPLPTGVRAAEPMSIPQADANRLLRGLVRFVADIPAKSNLMMVWENGGDELFVDAGGIDLRCERGLMTVGLTVSCDELPRPKRVTVPFAVGRADGPRGLLMSTFDRVDAPAIVADAWSDAIVAFCWEALLELVRRVSAQAGQDEDGLDLIPGEIASEDKLLLVHPMARHDLSGLTR